MLDTSVKIFRSTDNSAPGISNNAGSIIAILDACLINGYGTVTINSLVVSAGVATVTVNAGHGFTMIGDTGPVIVIAGATPSGLNAEWRINVVSTSVFTFACPTINDVTATGTITVKRSPAGWNTLFTATNKRAYQAKIGTRLPIYISEPASLITIGLYESMSDINNGVLVAQYADNVDKIYGASSPVPWYLIADAQTVYFGWMKYFHNPGRYGYMNQFFGDTIPFCTPDNFSSFITANQQNCLNFDNNTTNYRARLPGAFNPGPLSVKFLSLINGWAGISGANTKLMGTEILVLPVWLANASNLITDQLPGFYRANQAKSLMDNNMSSLTISNGHQCVVLDVYCEDGGNAYVGKALIDISGPWR